MKIKILNKNCGTEIPPYHRTLNLKTMTNFDEKYNGSEDEKSDKSDIATDN